MMTSVVTGRRCSLCTDSNQGQEWTHVPGSDGRSLIWNINSFSLFPDCCLFPAFPLLNAQFQHLECLLLVWLHLWAEHGIALALCPKQHSTWKVFFLKLSKINLKSCNERKVKKVICTKVVYPVNSLSHSRQHHTFPKVFTVVGTTVYCTFYINSACDYPRDLLEQ